MSVSIKSFGKTKDGTQVYLYTIKNTNKMSVSVTNYGACIVNVFVPDKKGKIEDVVLGFDDVTGYERDVLYFGGFVGRSCNRIADARFKINDITYELDKNDKDNNLHGGNTRYNKFIYNVDMKGNTVTFKRVSPHMEQGFPGNMNIEVSYTLTNTNKLKIEYRAVSDKDTVCNFTNHSYFNLGGQSLDDITSHEVYIKASGYCEISEKSVPTGKIIDVTNTPMDFRVKKAVGKNINDDYPALIQGNGYDHNYCLDKKAREFGYVAELSEKTSKRRMRVYTDMPGMQLYTGNYINNVKGKNDKVYSKFAGICFETQFYPNSVNIPSFESCVLKANEEFKSTTMYEFMW